MLAIAAVVVALSLAVEAAIAARHERRQRERGGIEPDGDVYALMRLAYPGAFAAMFAEGVWRGGAGGMLPAAGVALFAAAKALKWWAMASLGPAWTFRVIVVPGAPLVGAGPYRVMRHPNYVAVLGELIGAGLLTRSAIAGPLSILIFAPLLWKRIAVEESALRPPSRAAGRHR